MALDLAEVKHVFETHHLDQVNAYLEAGYVLIETGKGTWSDSGEPYIKYSLAWTKDTEAPRPKLY